MGIIYRSENRILRSVFISITAFYLVLLLLGMVNLTVALIPLVFIYCLIESFRKPSNVLVLYLIMLTSNGILERDTYLFGMIGILQVVNVFSLIILLFVYKKPGVHVPKPVKLFLSVWIFLFLYINYTKFKDLYFGNTDLQSSVVFFLNSALIWSVLILIVLKVPYKRFLFFKSMSAILLFQIISCILSVQLNSLGYYVNIVDADMVRPSGFIGNGDANTLSCVCAMGFAYFLYLSTFQQSKLYSYLFVFLSLVGVAFTGSRTGFILLMLVIFVFMIQRREIKKLPYRLILIVVAAILLFPLLEPTLERVQLIKEEQLTTKKASSNRVGKWMAYYQYIDRNPIIYLVGSSDQLLLNNQKRAAHNFYIQTVFNAGIFFLIGFIFLFYKTMRNNPYEFVNWLLKIIMLACLFFVSDFGIITYWIIFNLQLYFTRNAVYDNLPESRTKFIY